MKHKAKVSLAKRLRTRTEMLQRVPIFQSAGWELRKKQVRKRVLKREAVAKAKAQERKEKANG